MDNLNRFLVYMLSFMMFARGKKIFHQKRGSLPQHLSININMRLNRTNSESQTRKGNERDLK